MAWAKLMWFCLHGEVEIGGFGITDPGDPLQVIEFVTVRQEVDWAAVKFDDAAVADFFEDQVDAGRKPEQFARIWLHTHPGDSPVPSMTDNETFARVFGKCQWAVMFVLARTGKTYARLRFNTGPGGQVIVPVRVDWLRAFGPADHEAWAKEYEANIQPGRERYLSLPGRFGLDDFVETAFEDRSDGAAPFGAREVSLCEATDFDEEWLDLMCMADQQELDTAAEKVAVRWGMTDFADWADGVMSLPPDQQRQFRKEVEAMLQPREEVFHDDF